MQIDSYTKNETLVIAPSGKLDTMNAPKFADELKSFLDKNPEKCLLDLTNVSFLSSAGLQVLLAGAKISKQNKIEYGVCGMNEMVDEVFHLSGFHHFMQAFRTKEDSFLG